MQDQFDVTLEDGELLLEVELTTSLIVAASESDGPLSQEQIDAILGVTPHGDGGADSADPAEAADAASVTAPADDTGGAGAADDAAAVDDTGGADAADDVPAEGTAPEQ